MNLNRVTHSVVLGYFFKILVNFGKKPVATLVLVMLLG